MNKKKIVALLVASVMTIGVIGGTLAWFTSEDSVTNIFNTASVNNPDLNAGIDVIENFVGPDGNEIKPDEAGNSTYSKPVLPGDVFTKEVQVESEANYDQFVRARIEKVWKLGVAQEEGEGYNSLAAGSPVTHYKIVEGMVNGQKESIVVYAYFSGNDVVTPDWNPLDYSKIQLSFEEENFTNSNGTNTWYAPDGFNDKWEETTTSVGEWYYYNQKLEENGYVEEAGKSPTDITAHILEGVEFRSDKAVDGINIDNIYKSLRFDVIVKAESVQASNGAAADLGWDTTVPVATNNKDAYGPKTVTP